jgi:hypothetical protein
MERSLFFWSGITCVLGLVQANCKNADIQTCTAPCEDGSNVTYAHVRVAGHYLLDVGEEAQGGTAQDKSGDIQEDPGDGVRRLGLVFHIWDSESTLRAEVSIVSLSIIKCDLEVYPGWRFCSLFICVLFTTVRVIKPGK